ncbi:MAG: hypothetical protein COA50_00870 [Flavobacteriaceae bacterium]|nr:MAG: hypothetical protein COA50_00870 [Flavobacteriaceae bacterium]
MSYFNWKWIVLALAFCVLSCDKDIMPIEITSTDELDKQPEAKVEKIIRNGRFVFTSTASLNKTIEELQNGAPEKIASDFEKLYAVGFRSHKAIVNPNNEGLQAKFSKELMQKRQLRKSSINFSKESVVNDDEFIIDPAFASLVNENNEIIVNDILYKIINDSGVFMVHVKDSLHLFQYLENLKLESSNKSYFNAYNIRLVGGGYSRISERISKYVRALGKFGYYGGGRGFPGINWTTTGSALSEEIKLQNVITNLKKCGIKEPTFPGLFGNSLVCIDNFDSKHRIKTEFWDQSWGFYKSAGVLTKTQRRRFGIWWKSNADEIHLGINKILLKYDVPAPEIFRQKQPSNIHSD